MLACPYCQLVPHWHYARNCSWTRKVTCFRFGGCRHAQEVSALTLIVPDTSRAEVEAKWDAEAERLFLAYTTPRPWPEAQRTEWLRHNPGQELPARADGWSEIERERFRAKLWPKPLPLPSELFDRYRDEAPKVDFRPRPAPTDPADY